MTTIVNIQSSMNASDSFALSNSLEGNIIGFVGRTTTATTITIGTFTAQNYATGVKAKITASGQSGAFWTPFVGRLAQDTTRGGSTCFFWIDSDQGTATATISNRLASQQGFGLPAQCTPVNGDSVTIFNALPNMYITLPGGNQFFQFVDFQGGFTAPIVPAGLTYYDSSRFDVELFSAYGAIAAPWLTDCYVSSGGFVNGNGTWIGGVIVPSFVSFGGGGTGTSTAGSQTTFLADVLIESGTYHVTGPITIAGGFFAGAPDLDSYPAIPILIDGAIGTGEGYTANAQWGPGSFGAKNGVQVWADNANTALLLTGGYTIDGASTAWSFSGTTYTSGVSVTPANIASNGALMNPKTNTRIASAFTD